jgi:antitoxin component HigA of HigAB toxin-antitoxin module
MTEDDERLYAALLSERIPRVIRSEAENARALDEVEALMKRGDDLSPAESELLELLASLIESFEEEHYGASA